MLSTWKRQMLVHPQSTQHVGLAVLVRGQQRQRVLLQQCFVHLEHLRNRAKWPVVMGYLKQQIGWQLAVA